MEPVAESVVVQPCSPPDKPPEASGAQSPGYSILLVDDEQNVLSALKRVFRKGPYRILTASSGTEAMGILESAPVQLIVSDHRMPGMTGAELLAAVRSRWPETIRLMLTGHADVASIMGAVTDGAVFKFITKPWLDEDLLVTVARGLEQYQLQKEVRALRLQNHRQEERLQTYSSAFSQERGTLAKILLREKKIPQKTLDALLRQQRSSGDLMYRVMAGSGLVSETDITAALRKALGIEVIDLRPVRVSAQAASLLPPDFCRTNLVLPLEITDSALVLAMADPSDIFKRDNMENITGIRIRAVLAKGHEIEQKLGEVYGAAVAGEEGPAPEHFEDIDIVIEDSDEEPNAEELLHSSGVASVVRILNAALAEALRRKASDIHIEPRPEYTVVRLRIDGLLQDWTRLPPTLHNAVVSRVKILAKLDIAERRVPQDGRMTMRAPDRSLDLRVSCLPVLHGEKVVLRLLDRESAVWRIDVLGLEKEALERVRRVANRPQGMLICTGPTGSGKTTMLYSLMQEFLTATCSYGTIEDPVEYYIDQASQVQVREKVGLTFPAALRSMLRQDPDVILIGEMRDQETAQIAFRAALTGHFVLSSLHTNSAVAAITRLMNLGVETYLIASALECVIAQRLLRSVCAFCRQPAKPEPEQLHLLGLKAEDVASLQRGAGCTNCNGTGYSGRLGVFEVLEMSDNLRDLVLRGGHQSELMVTAREEGMQLLFEDTLRKVRQGHTTLEEMLRVIGPRAAHRPCPGCGDLLDAAFRVCPTCGRPVRRVCPKCAARLTEEWKYCPACGEGAAK